MTPEPFDLRESPLVGTNLIEASAGTGKTYTIAGLVLRLVLEAELPVERILVVTFTVAATEELRDRVRRRLREALRAFEAGESDDDLLTHLLRRHDAGPAKARLTAALRGFDEAPLFTIHGFCQRVLSEHAFESGLLFDAELASDQEGLLQEVVDDWWRREVSAGSPLLAAFAAARGFTPESLRALLDAAARHPSMEVVPPSASVEVEERRSALAEAFARLTAAWPEARGEVRRLLSDDPCLSRSKDNFGPEPLAACLTGLDRSLAGGAPPPACLGALHKVTRTSLGAPGVVKKGRLAPEHPFFDLCQALSDAADGFFLTLRTSFLAAARADLAAKKRARNVQGFDDLLGNLRAALAGDGGQSLARALRQRYRAALIDEFQDTDPVQYEIFDRVFGVRAEEPSLLFLIGDPKQAIYGFRGADVFAYLEASESAARRYTLGENWRSEPRLLRGVAALFSASERPFVFPRIGFPRVEAAKKERALLRVEGDDENGGAPLRVWFVPRTGENTWRDRIPRSWAERELPRAVAGEVSRLLALGREGKALLGDRPLGPGDVAVLVRRNREAELVQEALRCVGVPSVVYSTASLFASPSAGEVERVVQALAEPGSEALIRAALSTDLLGLDGEALHALEDDEEVWEDWLTRFRDLHDLWARRGFLPALRRLLGEAGVRERLLSLEDGERRLTDVLHLAEVLHRAAAEESLGMAGLVRWLSRRCREPAAGEEAQLRLESDERAVKLVTVHRSKGLEYPVVFCPFSWEGSELRKGEAGVKVHVLTASGEGRFVFDLGSPRQAEHARRAAVENLAENVRLLYVALTRAKNRCHLVWGGFSGAETSAPAYLLHPPEGELGSAGLTPLAEGVKRLTDDDLRAGLRPLEAGGGVSVEELPDPSGPAACVPPQPEAAAPAARVFRGRIASDWRATSFTALVSGAPADDELPDRDERSAGPQGTVPSSAAEGSAFAFPAGARAGTCLHEVLERADFSGGGDPPLSELVAGRLAAHGFGPELSGAAQAMVTNALAAPLLADRPDFTLSRVPRSERRHEVEFALPFRQGAGALTPGLLARFFREARRGGLADALGDRVPERLGRLEFSPVRGYLRGFLDLVFRFEGRYYLADWKSNRLGDRVEDYGPDALAQAMAREHYALQYHLYAAALHLHLRARLPGYDAGQHLGGVFYLFLRGVDPRRPGFGVFFDRPPPERVEGLARLLVGEGGP